MQKKNAMEKKERTAKGKFPFLNHETIAWLAGILVVTFFAFMPALKNGYINWDDNAYVFNNPHLAKPLPQAAKYFFGQNYFIGNYIPLTMITFAIEYHIAALKPGFYHLVNIIFHLANVLLVFWLIFLLSGRKKGLAALVAFFFGIHPMRVESVAWIAELKDVQYSLFFLAGLIAYYKYLETKVARVEQGSVLNLSPEKQALPQKNGTIRYLLVAFVFFVLSLLSKPAAVVFPLVLLLLDFYVQRKPDLRTWLEKVPFLALSVVFGIIAIASQQEDNLLRDEYSLFNKFFFASHSFLFYIVMLFVPVNQSIFYPYPPVVDGLLPFTYYAAPVLLIGLGYGVYRLSKQSRVVSFGFLFFTVNLLLVLQFVSVGDAVRADRYTYIPHIGLLFILAMTLEKFMRSTAEKLKVYRRMVLPVTFVIAVLFSFMTHARCKVWKDDNSLATDLLNKFPDDRLALNNKGFILSNQGRYEEAIEHFKKALAVRPDYTRASINLINTYMLRTDYTGAMQTVDSALKYSPRDKNLINKKGYLFFTLQNYPEASRLFNEAIRLDKKDVYGYMNLSQIYYAKNEFRKGADILDTALKYNPTHYILLNDKGYFLFLMKKYPEAKEYFRASLVERPGYRTAAINLENCEKALADSLKTKH